LETDGTALDQIANLRFSKIIYIEDYVTQLRWYAKVLANALKKPLKAVFIHLPIRGEMAEVELGE
jgi:hypothetical protein